MTENGANPELKPKYRQYEYNPTKGEYYDNAFQELEHRKPSRLIAFNEMRRVANTSLEREEWKYRFPHIPYLKRIGILVFPIIVGKTLHSIWMKTLEV